MALSSHLSVLSKRERYIAIGTMIALGLLAIDRFAVQRLTDFLEYTDGEKVRLSKELGIAGMLMSHRGELKPAWENRVKTGLKSDVAEARSQILHSIKDWAAESGIALSLIKPEQLTEKGKLPQIAFQASGTGNMEAVARLLWRIQSAKIPIRVTEMQLGARKEGVDDLSVAIRLSTVYSPPPPATSASAIPPISTGGR